MNRKIRLWKGPYFFLSIRKEQLVFQKKIIYNKHDVTYGAIAQLGERYAGSVEVRGSSPLGSIPVNPYSIRVFLFLMERFHSELFCDPNSNIPRSISFLVYKGRIHL